MDLAYLFLVPVSIILLIVAAKIASLVMDIAPFAYPNARIMAKQGRIISESTFEELSEARSLEDIVNLLKETEYTDYLSRYVGEEYGVLDIERAFNNHLASVYEQVYSFSPDSVKPIFEILLKRWDIENIIRTLRCIYANKNPNEYLINIGTFSEAQLDQLAKSSSTEEVAMSISSEFEHILNNVQNEDLIVIENELLRYYYESLWHHLENSRDKNMLLFKDYFGMQIDIINIMAAMRLNIMEEIEDIADNFLPVTYMVSTEDLKSIVSSEEISMVLNILSNTPYFSIFESMFTEYEKAKDISVFERALRDMLINKGKEISILNPLGIGPAIGYLTQKLSEVQRLKTVAIGIYEGIEPDKIKRYVGVMQ